MCRLFAFSFNTKTSKESRIHYVSMFKSLALSGAVLPTSLPGHQDGWGITTYNEDTILPEQYRSTLSAHLDSSYVAENFFSTIVPISGIAHIRKRTIGEISLVNTHPFVSEEYSFVHNGSIESCDLYASLDTKCEGQTDSERLFKRFIELKDNGILSTKEAYMKMILESKSHYPDYSAINTMLHDGKHIYVSRVVNEDSFEYSNVELLEYFTLYVGKTKEGGTLITSEKIPDDDILYSLLPNNSVSTLSLANGEFTTVQLPV